MSEAPVTENKKRFREIDVLYALGALLVILGHSHPNDWSTFPGEWVRFIYLYIIFICRFSFSSRGFCFADRRVLCASDISDG